MKKRWVRKLIYWIFIVLFLVTAPGVVLYTAGYRWNFSQGFLRTGTLFVASTPRNATILLDDKVEDEKTPTVVKTLMPTTYNIKLELKDHLTWDKELEIQEGETTFIENVLLFLELEPRLVLRDDMEWSAWSPSSRALAWAVNEAGWTEVWTSEIEKPASRLLHRAEYDKDSSIEWADNDTLEIFDGVDTVYVSIEGDLVEDPVPDTDATLVEADGMIEVLVGSKTIARLSDGNYSIMDERGPYILVFNEDTDSISLLNRYDENEPLLLQEDAMFAHWIREDALLFATNYEISMYEPSTHKTTLITRIGEKIHNAEWHPQGGYIFYTTSNELRAIELDERGGRRTTVLAELEGIQTFTINNRGNRAFLVADDGIDSGLFERQLYEPRGFFEL